MVKALADRLAEVNNCIFLLYWPSCHVMMKTKLKKYERLIKLRCNIEYKRFCKKSSRNVTKNCTKKSRAF